MPKPVKNLWDKILDWDNLVLAAKNASREKRRYCAILNFNADLEMNLLEIRDRLASEQWQPGVYRAFEVYEPKLRVIHAPCFPDRVVHHALVQIIEPYFEKCFIEHSFACRANKGIHAASKHLAKMLRSAHAQWDKVYVLKADISKYFNSINHEIMMQITSRIIGDKKVLRVLRALITNCSCIDAPCGLPLGALTSQLMANTYLNVFDHHIKDDLGIRHYVRYMDDFVILHHDKEALKSLLTHIREFLADKLQLTLNRKTDIFPANRGVDFAGYRHWHTHTLPRKRNMRRAKRRFAGLSRLYAAGRVNLNVIRSCVASFCGYMRHCKGWRSSASVLSSLVLIKNNDTAGAFI